MHSRTTDARSLFSSFALVLCVSAALAGCKSGGGGSSSAPAASGTSTPAVVTSQPTSVAASESVTTTPTSESEQNDAPTISGSIVPVVATNSAYSFKPLASDPDGDALAFQIENKPSWATFNTVTGQLSGTPKDSDAGTFADIVISVDDGTATSAMPPFSIAVTKAVVNVANLSWSVPTANTDGTAIADLAGFTIVYGNSQTALDQTIRIDNATASNYTLENFPSGTYYFAIKAFTTGGAESSLSNMVSKAFN
jgi:hypothetical protein